MERDRSFLVCSLFSSRLRTYPRHVIIPPLSLKVHNLSFNRITIPLFFFFSPSQPEIYHKQVVDACHTMIFLLWSIPDEARLSILHLLNGFNITEFSTLSRASVMNSCISGGASATRQPSTMVEATLPLHIDNDQNQNNVINELPNSNRFASTTVAG
jgi:hypothetical protein